MITRQRPLIFHLLTVLQTGGTERALVNALPGLKNFDHHVCSIYPFPKNDTIVLDAFKSMPHVQVSTLDVSQPFLKFTQAKKKCWESIHNSQPDLLITYLTHADIIGRFAVPKNTPFPVVSFLRSTLRDIKFYPFTPLNALTARRINGYFSVSKAAFAPYEKWFGMPSSACTIIPNGVAIPSLENIAHARDQILQEFSIDKKSFTFGYVAKMRPKKGFDTLIHAFALLHHDFPNTHLLLVGDGPLRPQIEHAIQKKGLSPHITLTGVRDGKIMLAAMDVFVFPSLFEGMSNALLEAMAAGKPIIASDIQENRELLEDPRYGLFFHVQDVNDLATKMRESVKNSSRTENLGKLARKRAREKYSLDQHILTFHDAIQKNLDEPPPKIQLFRSF